MVLQDRSLGGRGQSMECKISIAVSDLPVWCQIHAKWPLLTRRFLHFGPQAIQWVSTLLEALVLREIFVRQTFVVFLMDHQWDLRTSPDHEHHAIRWHSQIPA